MDEKAQVSMEYLLTVVFAILLVIIVTVIAFNISNLADKAQLKVLENRDSTIAGLMEK